MECKENPFQDLLGGLSGDDLSIIHNLQAGSHILPL